MGSNVVSQLFNRENGFVSFFARNNILRLQLITSAWCKVHTEMRQSFVPWAGDTHLFCAIFCRLPRDWMEFLGCAFRPKEFGFDFRRATLLDAALNPHLSSPMILP